MSGEKRRYISIEEQELRRLREQDSRLRSLQKDLPERLNTIRHEAQQDLRQRLAPLEERSRQQEQEAQRLKSNIATLERETHQRLRQQQRDFQAAIKEAEVRQQTALQAETQRLDDAMRQGFAEQRSLLLTITTEQREEYLALNQDLDQKMTHLIEQERQVREQFMTQLQQEKQDKVQLARDWLHDVELIIKQIEQNYQHERFTPGKLSDLKRTSAIAQNNLQRGAAEAALVLLQQNYLGLSDLRIELEQKQLEWEFHYNRILEDLKLLIEEVQNSRVCEAEIGQGEESQRFLLEVDYWTNGRLSRHEQTLQSLDARLNNETSTLSLDDLKSLETQIEDLRPELAGIMQQAHEEILSSQIRAEIADKVARVLAGMGYRLVEPEKNAGYEQEDQRGAYVLKVQDVNQGAVVAIISPGPEARQNIVSLNSFGAVLQNETAIEQNHSVVKSALEKVPGLILDKEECEPNPQYRYENVEVVLQRPDQVDLSLATEQFKVVQFREGQGKMDPNG